MITVYWLEGSWKVSAMKESDEVRLRYERRSALNLAQLYSPLLPHNYLTFQEKERKIITLIRQCDIEPIDNKRVLEIGCGTGANLLLFLGLGFHPENLIGNELLESRAADARKRLPIETRIIVGDAAEVAFPDSHFDIVFQSTVFTSLLDDAFQQRLADRMWAIIKPGGGVIWYDFVFNNPFNPDVRGVPVRRIKALFPHGNIRYWRLTLAPPISRLVTRVHPILYGLLNLAPFLRTHVLCWVHKMA